MIGWLRRIWFKKAVHVWRVKIRLHRELEKEVRKLSEEVLTTENLLVRKLNVTMLDLYVPEYRQLDDELRTAFLSRRTFTNRKLHV